MVGIKESGGEGGIHIPPPKFCQEYWQISALTTNATSHLRPSRMRILPVSLGNQIARFLVAMVVTLGSRQRQRIALPEKKPSS